MNTSSHHAAIYCAPPLTSENDAVLGEIHQMRKELRHVLRTPRRWEGLSEDLVLGRYALVAMASSSRLSSMVSRRLSSAIARRVAATCGSGGCGLAIGRPSSPRPNFRK